MTTTTTNPPNKITIQQDWSQAFGSLMDLNYDGRKVLQAILIGILGAYTLAAFLHAIGWGAVNIFLGIGVWVAIASHGFQPLAIGLAALGGLGYAIVDPKVNVVPGVKAGLEALGRIVNFAMMLTGFTFLFYGTWPLGIPFMGYPIILMGIVFVNNILFYERMGSSGWAWKIGGYYTIILLVMVLFGQVAIVKATGNWINKTQEAAAAKLTGNKPTPLTDEEQADLLKTESQTAAREAASAAAAEVAAEEARKAAIPPLVQATGDKCGGDYENLKDCKSVVFERDGLKYDLYPDTGYCPAADPISAVTTILYPGDQQVTFIPINIGVRVRFFQLKVGESFGGATCGKS